ncbi:MAG: hypothetical protein Q8S73_34410 [Deltaproteobacteria bacterium]|nr:hypothetical protein [Myxococcales bacterium]MDP3219243.1 hypothetical protein [Deltaproteobacteria bacterium]
MDTTDPPQTRKSRRIEEAVLEVDGVVGVRIWELPDRVEVGIRVAPIDAASDVLQRVRELIEAMREGDERWEIGLLTEP